MLWMDRLSLYRWSMSPDDEPAILEEEGVPFESEDLLPLLQGKGIVLIDAAARRYGVRPSQLIGIDDDLLLSLDFDIAVTAKSARREARPDDEEVEVEDGFGKTWKIPRRVLIGDEDSYQRELHTKRPEDYIKLYGRGKRELTVTAGGEMGDGIIGPMPVPGSVADRTTDWRR
jgi:hypothetical protein